MNLISGRIDMVLEEEDMLEFFVEMQTYFDMNDFIFVFEDKTKTGLDCKPHYHFIGNFTHKRDTVAKWLGSYGKGYYSTHLVTDDEKQKAYWYILKQQDVVFHDLEEYKLKLLLDQSLDYNKNLSTLNGFRAHYTNKIMQLMAQEKLSSRSSILLYIIDYVTEWNLVNKDRPMFLPNSNQMLAYIQYYEQLYIKNPVKRQMDDYTFIFRGDDEYDEEFKEINEMETINPLDIII